MDDKLKELVLFQIRRRLTNLTKEHLVQLESIAINYPIDYDNFRKRSLDGMNDGFRELEELINTLTITINQS